MKGNAISGNININADTDIRRTCEISIAVKKHTFKIESGGKLWLDKYIQIYYGIIKKFYTRNNLDKYGDFF